MVLFASCDTAAMDNVALTILWIQGLKEVASLIPIALVHSSKHELG